MKGVSCSFPHLVGFSFWGRGLPMGVGGLIRALPPLLPVRLHLCLLLGPALCSLLGALVDCVWSELGP